jgi:hypothetical protein
MNKRCFIIGGGPSINNINFDLIKHEFVIGINEAFRLGNWINIWYFSDSNIFKTHRKEIDIWPNRIVSCAGIAKNHKKIEHYERCRQHTICFEPGKLAFPSRGANSGATAINLAIREGFETIILIGYDMQQINGKNNYHDYYKKIPRPDVYDRFSDVFVKIASEATVEIINANPNSALQCFPKMKLEDLL